VLEACEYKDSFLKFKPKICVINNFDLDHLDYFKNQEQLEMSFNKFLNNSQECVIINQACKINNIIDLNKKQIYFSLEKNAKNIRFDKKNKLSVFDFVCEERDLIIKNIKLKALGEFNIMNAIACIFVCLEFKIDINFIRLGLENFSGTQRRLEFKGEFKQAKIYDDYAHHPREILEVIKAVKNSFEYNNLFCVFQPHTYSRTKFLFDGFAQALSNKFIDKLILLKIYAAREINEFNICSRDLEKKINLLNGHAKYFSEFDLAQEYLINNIKEHDLILTLGAGDAYLIGENLAKLDNKKISN
jgi:UDP-N-acetylmuramate--alanine ligase